MTNPKLVKRYVTYEQAEVATGIPGWKLRKWVTQRRLPSYKPDGDRGLTFLRIEEIQALMEANRRAARRQANSSATSGNT